MRRYIRKAVPRRRLYSRMTPRPVRRPAAASKHNWVQSIVSGLTVLTAIAALVYTSRSTTEQLRLTEQGQITDRYSRATDQLGSEKIDVRLGAIYSLERLMRDSAADVPTIVEVLCAFVREHAPRKVTPPSTTTTPPRPSRTAKSPVRPPPDVQAVLTVLNRRPDGGSARIDLHQTELAGADLSRAKLAGADLTGANLAFVLLHEASLENALLRQADLHNASLTHARLHSADLSEANMVDATLTSADLTRAHLDQVDLTYARLGDATLNGADLPQANLTRASLGAAKLMGANLFAAKLNDAYLGAANLSAANLTEADLTGADATTPEQLAQARTNSRTKLPNG
ncbi:pentapeptide repeat-containing protein [Amycolatopsis thailandensis]|uniref:pentapeptide repeat-containing protein n=1 Tax=Amycolatopsis thailandensis TaxID=589330 RepID=UPI0037AD3A97